MKTLKLIAAALMINCLSYGATTLKHDDPIKKQTINITSTPVKKESKAIMEDGNYRNAIGIRMGGSSGLTIKHKFLSGNAFEGIVGFWPNALGLTGLYEMYVPAGATGLNWYFGGGGHVALTGQRTTSLWEGSRRYNYPTNWTDGGSLAAGIDGIAGIEWKTPRAPFAFSFDLKPLFEVNSNGGAAVALDPALGIKVAW